MTLAADSALNLAVVGHTNTGKTSLLRTLMRDASFGEVAPTAATTRQVAGAALEVDGEAVVELYDTPGLEDAGALIEALESIPGERHDGPDRVRALLSSDSDRNRFEQECRVLEQLLESDAALYVIDAREPVLGKYQDELAVLAMCARPILPVLNFVAAQGHRSGQWREALARVGLHAIAEFDTVVFSIDAEAALWSRLVTLLDDRAAGLSRLIDARRELAEWQQRAALRCVAELLVDAAGAQQIIEAGDDVGEAGALDELRARIRAREQRGVEELLTLFRFDPDVHHPVDLPLSEGRWSASPFDPALVGDFARSAGTGAGAGAGAGAAFDMATGGLSLGAGTLTGVLIGGGIGAAWQPGRQWLDRALGQLRVQVDDATLLHLAARNLELVHALQQRGHAATRSMEQPGQSLPSELARALRRPLLRARLQPKTSKLNSNTDRESGTRDRCIVELVEAMESEHS